MESYDVSSIVSDEVISTQVTKAFMIDMPKLTWIVYDTAGDYITMLLAVLKGDNTDADNPIHEPYILFKCKVLYYIENLDTVSLPHLEAARIITWSDVKITASDIKDILHSDINDSINSTYTNQKVKKYLVPLHKIAQHCITQSDLEAKGADLLAKKKQEPSIKTTLSDKSFEEKLKREFWQPLHELLWNEKMISCIYALQRLQSLFIGRVKKRKKPYEDNFSTCFITKISEETRLD